MDDTQAKAASESATAADLIAAGKTPQLDIGATSLEQLDALFETGTAELPHTVSGEGEPTGKVEDPPAKIEPKPGEEPASAKVDEQVVVEEEVVETRSAEEIEQAQTDARERVKAEGGDEAAQEAAAVEAGKPVKSEAEPVVEKPVVESEIERIQRPRLKDPVDQQVAAVKKAADAAGMPISWAEAERRVKGDPPAAAVEPAKVEPPTDHEKIVGDLETEVAELQRQVDAKTEVEGNFDKAAAKLMNDLADKKSDLKLAKRDMSAAQAAAQVAEEARIATSEENRLKAHTTAIEEYPDVVDKKVGLGLAVSQRIAALKSDPNHPDRPILFADSAPLTIVRMVAAEMGIAPVKKVTPPAKTKVVAPLRKVVTPAPASKTSVPAQTVTPEETKKRTVAYLKTEAPLEELDAFFGMGDKNQLLAGAIR